MNKRVIAQFTLVVVTISAHSQALSQTRCSLTEATSPSIRGLRLGMSTQELLALFPGSVKSWAKEPKEIREAREKALDPNGNLPFWLVFDPTTDAARDQFASVDSVSVGVYKGRVTDFSLAYSGTEWNNIDQWVAKVSESLRLPGRQAWVTGPSEAPNKVLNCSGIEIEAAIQGGGSSIRIRNTEYLKGPDDRANTLHEKKRRDFKP